MYASYCLGPRSGMSNSIYSDNNNNNIIIIIIIIIVVVVVVVVVVAVVVDLPALACLHP